MMTQKTFETHCAAHCMSAEFFIQLYRGAVIYHLTC